MEKYMKYLIPLLLLLSSCASTGHSRRIESDICLPNDSKSDKVIYYVSGATHMLCYHVSNTKPEYISWKKLLRLKYSHMGHKCDADSSKYLIKIRCEK